MIYDLIVIGMGPAGITAALYAKRSNLNVLILEKNTPGGLVTNIDRIDNYPGYISISGAELSYNMLQNIKDNDIPYKISEVKDIKVNDEYKEIITNKETYKCQNIIIATGRKSKKLGLENEKELLGKGISTCAICDGMFYKDQDIAIVGGGNSAFQEALYLAKIVKNITLIHRNAIFKADQTLIDKVKKQKNIKIKTNSVVTKINAKDGLLSDIEINNNEILKIKGLFIYIGYESANEFVPKIIDQDDLGYIKVNQYFETNIKGIYAIGGAINTSVNQIITVSAQGAECAMNIVNRRH